MDTTHPALLDAPSPSSSSESRSGTSEATPFFPFRSLPKELRIRVLEHTHLGPPGLGGYNAKFEQLLLEDGKLVKEDFDWGMRECTPCPSASHNSPSAVHPCGCRELPTALFLVDRLMYQEAAVEVFFANASFNFWGDDLGATLAFLRDLVPRAALPRWRRVRFSMTEVQCEGWTGGTALACGYPGQLLEWFRHGYWPDENQRPQVDYQADWRAVLRFLAAHADLPRLHVTVDMAQGSWTFVEDVMDGADRREPSWFRFIYDFYMDVVTAMCCELKGLGGLRLYLCAFGQMAPWLEREVLGHEGDSRPMRHPANWQMVPQWNDMSQRLEGSNYYPQE